MPLPAVTAAQIASALQHSYPFSFDQALALAAAGPTHIRAPGTVPGMGALVERLAQALQSREPLVVFGDFDADGVTGTAILFAALSAHSDRVRRYTPFYHEGYGLHVAQVEDFDRQGLRVIVTVDSGVSSYEAVARAHELGLTVLVTDHHLPHPDRGPAGTLAINPPDYLLSGAQLAYLTAQAVRERLGGPAGPDPWGLALSAVGAQADWVPVDRPETRAWVAQGLAAIHSPACPQGLHMVQEVLEERPITSEMRPLWGLLNVGKRSPLVDPNHVVEALLPTTPPARCREIVIGLVRDRAQAYAAAESFTAEALEGIRAQAGDTSGLFVHEVPPGDDTLSEVEGPLASRVAAMLGRPVLLLRRAGKQVNFSGRARGGFSFESFLSDPAITALTLAMGGHRQAIGGSLRPPDSAAFIAAVRRWAERQPPAAPPPPSPPPLKLNPIDPLTAYLYGRAMGPFGNQLRAPRFQTRIAVRGGWAFSGDFLLEVDRPLGPGEWDIGFRFDEAGCDGERTVLRLEGLGR